MGRPRFQTAYVKQVGNRKFRCEYNTYPNNKRRDRSKTYSNVTETEARRRIAEVIAREAPSRPDGRVSLRWFVENRWLTMKESGWKASTDRNNRNQIENQILKPLGNIPLEELDKFTLQSHLNKLADEEYSKSIVGHTKSFLKAILDEAHEQDYIPKNPASRLDLPRIRRVRSIGGGIGLATGKPFLSMPQLRVLLSVLEGRGRLLAALCSVMALRPGEALALTWEAYNGTTLDIVQ
jgi:integrase